VARHVQFGALLADPTHPRVRTVLRGLPPTGVYHLAWTRAVPTDEPAVTPVETRLRSVADTLLVRSSAGERDLVYPADHPLTDAAERCGIEHLVAAFLYLHFRVRAGEGAIAENVREYQALADEVINLLGETREPVDAQFAREVERWIRDTGSERKLDG
jgi:hypothetical protein